ncbi:MAG TPA: OsmC family protein [Armatimonadota bacterium]|jgi:putative redox protein
MHFDPLTVSVDLIDDKVRFAGALRANAPVTVDYTPPIGGGQGYTSLELFLYSLTTCLGTSVLLVLRKMQKTITGCHVQAHGIRREEHPTCFARIALELVLQSPDATESDVQHALRIAEDSLCPVWAMIKNNVEVSPSFQLITPQPVDAQPV